MTKSEILNPKTMESDLNLAEFLTPLASAPESDTTSVPPEAQFPSVFYVHDRITNSVQQVHLALARLNAVSPEGPVIFRQEGRLVRVVRTEDGMYAVVPLDRNRLRLAVSEAGGWKRVLKGEVTEADNALLDAAVGGAHWAGR